MADWLRIPWKNATICFVSKNVREKNVSILFYRHIFFWKKTIFFSSLQFFPSPLAGIVCLNTRREKSNLYVLWIVRRPICLSVFWASLDLGFVSLPFPFSGLSSRRDTYAILGAFLFIYFPRVDGLFISRKAFITSVANAHSRNHH